MDSPEMDLRFISTCRAHKFSIHKFDIEFSFLFNIHTFYSETCAHRQFIVESFSCFGLFDFLHYICVFLFWNCCINSVLQPHECIKRSKMLAFIICRREKKREFLKKKNVKGQTLKIMFLFCNLFVCHPISFLKGKGRAS
jgi:hypothetical protein